MASFGPKPSIIRILWSLRSAQIPPWCSLAIWGEILDPLSHLGFMTPSLDLFCADLGFVLCIFKICFVEATKSKWRDCYRDETFLSILPL